MDKLHYIHSRGGRIGDGETSSPADIDAILAALRADGRKHLVLHFHGGLVAKASGLAIAERLSPAYAEAGYPVFYVWETGAWEAIRNNLGELADEPIFKQLVRKLLEYALQRLGAQGGTRSILPGNVDPGEVKQTVDRFWQAPSQSTIPYRGIDPTASPFVARSASTQVDEAEIQADLEQDAEFAAALATLPDLPPGTRSALAAPGAREHRSAFSLAIADQVSEVPGSRGLITWFKVALLVKNILVNLLRRYADGRDHGLYATVVEEIVREVKLGGSGLNEWGKALQWNRMKQDALDAFSGDADMHAGSALLARLKSAIDDGLKLERISLIGHSTGAIYIAHWLDAAHRVLPHGLKLDVIFLAPAITYDLFDRTVAAHSERIGNFRMFCMQDALERDDQVWGDETDSPEAGDLRRFIYPSSLLYLVSGILESHVDEEGVLLDEPDMPLLGMERFLTLDKVYDAERFPAVGRVRAWLRAAPNRLVWSRAEGGPAGLNSASIDHGAFDDDAATVASLKSILKAGW